MEMKVHRGGMLTTVQDLGRRGYRWAGVPLSGAMDAFALRLANGIVGNPESAATLEISLVGPELEFAEDIMIALGGAEFDGLPSWKPVAVRAGERVVIGSCRHGCRGYLAITGGIDVEPVVGSRSTYLRGGFGGHEGRSLRDGDRLRIAGPAARGEPHAWEDLARPASSAKGWSIDPRILPPYSSNPIVRVLRGAQAGEFGDALFAESFRVSPQSDRMGLRLLGAKVVRRRSEDLLSSALLPGTIQIPPDGQPLVLMADAQTIGGYPQAAHVISVDLPLLAQLRTGDTVRFVEVTLEEAHRLALGRERAIAILREGLAEKLDGHSTR